MVVDMFRELAPDVGWWLGTHPYTTAIHGQPVSYLNDVWRAPQPRWPEQQANPKMIHHEQHAVLAKTVGGETRVCGWKLSQLRACFPRAGCNTIRPWGLGGPNVQYHLAVEAALVAGVRGFGRLGADFWALPMGKVKRNIIALYPETPWQALNMNNSHSYILAPGKDGPLATIRLEMVRDGLQQAEARVFLEKLLTDEASRTKLGDPLARACQQVLDDRTRALLVAITCGDLGWQNYAAHADALADRLYAAAAEAAAAIGARP
jgi:hypothetical protein